MCIDYYVYWSPEKVEPNPVEFINAVPYQKPRKMPPPYQAKAIQATAYALMVYLRNNWFSAAQPIMKWLNTQRNHYAGFAASTVICSLFFFVMMFLRSIRSFYELSRRSEVT